MAADTFLHRRLKGGHVVLDEPIAGESVRRTDLDVVALDGHETAWLEPRFHNRPGNLSAERIQDAAPKGF